MKLFLYGIKDFSNLALIARSAEHFGITHCYVYNAHHDVNRHVRANFNDYPKGLRRRLVRISGGAITLIRIEVLSEYKQFLAAYPGRVVAASLRPTALALQHFRFAADDCLVFGCEASGLPPELLACCETEVTIMRSGKTQSLNLAVAVAIMAYTAAQQYADLKSL